MTERDVLDVRPMSGAIGAHVHNVDLTTLTDEGFASIQELLGRHHVLILRGQSALTPQAQIGFGRLFGEIQPHPYVDALAGHPEITEFDFEAGNKLDVWHTGLSMAPSPLTVITFHMIEVPPAGGDTMWSNQYLAYEHLSAPMRGLLDGLSAIHAVRSTTGYVSRTEHPLVRIEWPWTV